MHPKLSKFIFRVLFCHDRKRIHCNSSLEFNGCIKSSFLGDWSHISKLARQLVQKTLNPKILGLLGFLNLEKPKIKKHTHTYIYID
jgi:hypothetical protein